jgi:hypothetical protein
MGLPHSPKSCSCSCSRRRFRSVSSSSRDAASTSCSLTRIAPVCAENASRSRNACQLRAESSAVGPGPWLSLYISSNALPILRQWGKSASPAPAREACGIRASCDSSPRDGRSTSADPPPWLARDDPSATVGPTLSAPPGCVADVPDIPCVSLHASSLLPRDPPARERDGLRTERGALHCAPLA